MRLFFYLIIISSYALWGCVELHNVQIGDVMGTGKKISVEVSDIGVNMEASMKAAGKLSNKNEEASKLNSIISMFQYGPQTGNIIYRPQVWANFSADLLSQCPNGIISGLTSTREFRNFNFVSTETATVTGYCTGD